MSSNLNNEFLKIIKTDLWMMNILKTVRDLKLNDCWIGAGFIRNKIWDVKHNKTRTDLNDIDVIYFDKIKVSKKYDVVLEKQLQTSNSTINWSVKNQARMHLRNKHKQYVNCDNAISFWPETATAIAIRINDKNDIEYIAPYGLEDLFGLLVVPTPNFDFKVFKNRIEKKQWMKIWNKLAIKTN